MQQNIDVFILCGGLGKRLRSVSGDLPKPMVRVGTRPLLDIIINYLKRFGFRRFILGIGYKAEVIEKYYEKNKDAAIEIVFSKEKIPLGTGGAVKNAMRLIKSKCFLVLNGDTLCRFNADKFLESHKQKKADVSILLRRIKDAKDYGLIQLDAKSRITAYLEKDQKAKAGLINAGVYCFDKKIFKDMPVRRKFSLEYDFFPSIAGKKIFGYVNNGLFFDIGTPERLVKARKILRSK